jgi:hypothetical protein
MGALNGLKDVLKIDRISTIGGLDSASGSLAWRIARTERRLHNYESWAGVAAVPDGEAHVADFDSMTPFVLDAGNDTWGDWVQLLGSEDTPVRAEQVEYIMLRSLIFDAEKSGLVRLQFSFGDSGASGLDNGMYTDLMMLTDKKVGDDFTVIMEPQLDGTKVWGRCWLAGENTGTISIFLGLCEYEG